MSVLFYRRPDYVAKLPGPMNVSQCQVYVERTQKHRRSIPPELSFENVTQNRALPPCALQDFMDYLVYVSHDAENLQFWLWLQDYSKRFYAASKSDQALSPAWHEVEAPQPLGNPQDIPRSADKSQPVVRDYEVNFDNVAGESPISPSAMLSPGFDKQSFMGSARSAADSVEDANHNVGLKWQPFTVQPFRSEINRVISHYLAPNSPRELNLSHRNRTAVLHALQHTTHPSAFDPVKEMVEATLRGQSHPNFIRWSICNGNKPRVVFVVNAGIAHVVLAVILAVLLILSHESRWWRLFVFPLFFCGFDIGVAAYKGLCVIIHTTHNRALRPWEQFGDGHSVSDFGDDEATLSTDDVYSMSHRSKKGISLDTFGTSNSYGHEIWVEKYKSKSVFRKVFARQVWVQDETIRLLQDRIVVQSHMWSALISVPLTALVVAIPRCNVI